jgi:hypothetical protein
MNASEMGKKGGSARVAKGASMWSKRKRREVAKRAAAARWKKFGPGPKPQLIKKSRVNGTETGPEI